MGMTVHGADLIAARLENLEERSTKAALKALRDGTDDVLELAVDYAPVDEGNLEKALTKAEPERNGINGRYTFSVYVDDSLDTGDGRKVGEYSLRIHEGLGWSQLGKKSRDKANRTGKAVGPKFLERAIDELEPDIKRAVAAAVKRAKDKA